MLRLAYVLPLLTFLALAGCDAFSDFDPAPAPPDASLKLRHWDLLNEGIEPGHAALLGDSTDFIVTFSSLVSDPVAAAETLFQAQEVVKRDYYRDSFTGVAVTVPTERLPDILNGLVASDSVSYVEPDVPLTPEVVAPIYVDLAWLRGVYGDGEWYRDQLRPWTVKRIEANSSWAKSGDGQGTVNVDVYVIDGPIAHADLNVVERRSFLPAGVTPASTLHGTHVAGIIGAMDDSDGLVGVAPGARIHALEVLDAAGATTLSTLLSAVEYVTQQKLASPSVPLVANLSVGLDIGTTALNALDEAVARSVEAGVVFVASAGNGAANASTYSPAHAPGVIAVAATDYFESFAGTFSNYGATVDILAPGVDVLSTADGNRYALLSGTSMAAPHVAGSAALYLARNPSATPAAVLARMIEKGKDASNNGLPSGTTRRRIKAKEL